MSNRLKSAQTQTLLSARGIYIANERYGLFSKWTDQLSLSVWLQGIITFVGAQGEYTDCKLSSNNNAYTWYNIHIRITIITYTNMSIIDHCR